MPSLVKVWDLQLPGQRSDAGEISVPERRSTARELIETRVRSSFTGSVRFMPPVTDAEALLNGERPTGQPDVDTQVQRALRAFGINGFLLFVDGAQVTELDAPVDLREESEIEFIRLTPLMGG